MNVQSSLIDWLKEKIGLAKNDKAFNLDFGDRADPKLQAENADLEAQITRHTKMLKSIEKK